jgi:enolase
LGVLIEDSKARLCYDSRGNETVEVDILKGSHVGRAAAPAGASVGKYEVPAFPKGGPKACVDQIRSFSRRLVGREVTDIRSLTRFLREVDGTESYQRIGGSAAFAITFAAADLASKVLSQPLFSILSSTRSYHLPYPLGNVIGGGSHAGPGTADIQELLACPTGAKNIQQALEANFLVHREVRKIAELRDPLFTGGRGDEGAWAISLTNDEALEIAASAIESVAQRLGFTIRLGVDLAASSLWNQKEKAYIYKRSGKRLSPERQIDYVIALIEKYELFYVEDPLCEEAFADFQDLTRQCKDVYITGDDLFATNIQRLVQGAEIEACNSAILKVNQAGGVGDALMFSEMAGRCGYDLVTSHRSGDTPDSHIAHIAVATGSKMLKSGVVGGERVAKLNELLRIDEELKGGKMITLEA